MGKLHLDTTRPFPLKRELKEGGRPRTGAYCLRSCHQWIFSHQKCKPWVISCSGEKGREEMTKTPRDRVVEGLLKTCLIFNIKLLALLGFKGPSFASNSSIKSAPQRRSVPWVGFLRHREWHSFSHLPACLALGKKLMSIYYKSDKTEEMIND